VNAFLGKVNFIRPKLISRDIDNIFAVMKELIEKDSKPLPRNKIEYRHYD